MPYKNKNHCWYGAVAFVKLVPWEQANKRMPIEKIVFLI
jgi:hypothetical protein